MPHLEYRPIVISYKTVLWLEGLIKGPVLPSYGIRTCRDIIHAQHITLKLGKSVAILFVIPGKQAGTL